MNAWIPLVLNATVAALGALQGADWIHLVGSSQAGWIASVISTLNLLAHASAGAGPAFSSSKQQ